MVMLDPGVLKYPGGGADLGLLEANDLKYDIQSQVFPNVVTFWREATELKEVAPHKVRSLLMPARYILGILFCFVFFQDPTHFANNRKSLLKTMKFAV